MTLRLKIVLALVALVAVGLVCFGVVTYALYARAQYDRLDDQLRNAIPLVSGQLYEQAGLEQGPMTGQPPPNEHPGRGGGPPVVVPPSAYGELRSAAGEVVTSVALSGSTDRPKLATDLTPPATGTELITTGSVEGGGQWRAAVTASTRGDGFVSVVAVPMTDVTDSLHRLVLIEVTASGILLALLALGSWIIVRRGLQPLEHMATSARSISGGSLSERVAPSDGRTEVGQLGLALNTMLDEIEAAFQERAATEHRLRQFLADASHELRTPLTSIQGFTELAQLDAARDGLDQAVILRRIEEESARMKVLVDDLLLLAQLDQTRPVERAEVDLVVVAADACTDAVAVAPDRTVTLSAPAPVVVLGDSNHLRQAVANLVANALQHTPGGTPIEVSVTRDADAAVLIVRDHGSGLSDEALAHAFDRFWQADPARVGTHAGLGLAIVAGIAGEHGGSATAANAPGGGAAFTLRLPQPEPQPLAADA
jgi:two-component system OmpR family sensor kinase